MSEPLALAHYLATLSRTQHELSGGFRALRRGHPREPDLCGVCERLAAQCRDQAERLEPFLRRYRSADGRDPRGTSPGLVEMPRLQTTAAEAGGFEAGGFEAAGLETPDLQRMVREAAGRERAGIEEADPGAAWPPRVTPVRGGGGLGLLRDLHVLYLLAAECDLSWSVVAQAARGLKDDDLLALTRHCAPETAVQLLWLRTRMRQAAPQALVVPSW